MRRERRLARTRLRSAAIGIRNRLLGTSQLEAELKRVEKRVVSQIASVSAGPPLHYCPVCASTVPAFRPGPRGRPNACCPICGSLERHRLLWLYLQLSTPVFRVPTRLLHFAPERSLRDRFKMRANIDYVSGDLDSPIADVKLDIQELAFEDSSFDFILCSHVLEHIPDDRRAMAELRRVLRPGGVALVAVPLRDADTTLEDPSIVTPEDRERHYGQADHVRYYGRDFPSRLEAAGFSVRADDPGGQLDEPFRALLGLNREIFFYCQRR